MNQPGKIRILHLIRSIGYGGAENQVVQLLNGLDSSLFSKHLITLKHEEVPNFKNLNNEIQYSVIPRKRLGHIHFLRKLTRYLRDNHIHIVQSHLFQSNLFAALAARIANRPVVVTTEHGKNLWKRKVHHRIERHIISPLVHKRVAVSEDIHRIRIQTGDIPESQTVVIPPCVPLPNTPSPPMLAREGINIVSVGRLVEAKNYRMLLMALKLMVDDGIDANLTIIGDGPERSELQDWIDRHQLKTRIQLTGFMSGIVNLLPQYDVFALSSIREGIPVAMLEAMAAGLPVVATSVGGIPDVLGDNDFGLLVQANDPADMHGALKKLYNSKDLRKRLSGCARKKIETTYSQQAVCAQYEQLYLDICPSIIHGKN